MTVGNEVEEAFVDRWIDNAYGCFSSGHKFCREVCPVMQVTRNENHTPTAFHANIVAMSQGGLAVEDVIDDYVHCTMCGACELRCPNTLFTGDFYRHRTQTVRVVKAMRALAVESGIHQPNWERWNSVTDERRNEPVVDGVSQDRVAAWAEGLDLPIGGETIMFCDCEAAFYRTSVARATAMILQAGGVEFGLMAEQWCCGGPAAEMGYADQARRFAEHNVADWRAAGARRIIAIDPHDYVAFTEDYPDYFGDAYDFEIVYITELVAGLISDGRLDLTNPIDRTVTYHDPCRLNKRKGIWESPAHHPGRHPRYHLPRRRPGHAVVVLLGRRGRLPHRAARDRRGDRPAPDGAGRRTRRGHPGQRLRLVGAPPRRAGEGT